MKATIIHAYGTADVLHAAEIPMPSYGPEEILIRLIASAVNPVDYRIRSGMLESMMPLPFPLTLGWEGAGIVAAVGTDVKNFATGDAVYTMPTLHRGGTYAEYVAVAASEVARKPVTLTFAQAAALPMGGLAAWTALFIVADIKQDQRVLIHGGAGALGSIAIQLAKWHGAHVITTASGSDRELMYSFGADEVIDYRTEKFHNMLGGLDAVISTIPGSTQDLSYSVLKPGGILVATAALPSIEMAIAAGVRAEFMFAQPSGEILRNLATLADTGVIRVITGREFSLEHAATAHALCESGTAKGKIILHIGPP